MATVKELKEQARDQRIEGYSSMSKAELESALGVASDDPEGESGPRSLVAEAGEQSPFGLPVGSGSRESSETIQPSTAVDGHTLTTVSAQEAANTWQPFAPMEWDDGYGEAAGATRDSAGERSAGIVTRRKAIVGEA